MLNKNSMAIIIVSLMFACAIPLILFSESRQAHIQELIEGDGLAEQRSLAAVVIVALFALDIFLPIPSSAVCAVAGRVFGIPGGIALCWLGLNLSAWIGYRAAFHLGWPLARRLTNDADLHAVKRQIDHWGIWPLVALRPVPVLSEASILLMGTYRYPTRWFWPPVIAGNFLVAVTFVSLGRWFSDRGQFWLGLLICCLIPAVFLSIWALRSRWR